MLDRSSHKNKPAAGPANQGIVAPVSLHGRHRELPESGADKFGAAMRRLCLLHDAGGAAGAPVIGAAARRFLDISFVKGQKLTVGQAQQIISGLSLEIKKSDLRHDLWAPAGEVLACIPFNALKNLLADQAIEGAQPLDDASLKSMRLIRQMLKTIVSAARTLDRSHEIGPLSSLNWAMGQILDIYKHQAPLSKVPEFAKIALSSQSRCGPGRFEVSIRTARPGGILDYLDENLEDVARLVNLSGRDSEVELATLHDCRKGLQCIVNIHRLIALARGASSRKETPHFAATLAVSERLGGLHDQHNRDVVVAGADYGNRSLVVDPELIEVLRLIVQKTRIGV